MNGAELVDALAQSDPLPGRCDGPGLQNVRLYGSKSQNSLECHDSTNAPHDITYQRLLSQRTQDVQAHILPLGIQACSQRHRASQAHQLGS